MILSFIYKLLILEDVQSKSNLVSVHLGDDEDPDNPVITDVSVNSNGQSVISWKPTIGAEKYAIYLYSSIDGWLSIDTVENSYRFLYLSKFKRY